MPASSETVINAPARCSLQRPVTDLDALAAKTRAINTSILDAKRVGRVVSPQVHTGLTPPELRDQIQQLQRSHSDGHAACQTVTPARDESLHRRLTAAHERISQLCKEKQRLSE